MSIETGGKWLIANYSHLVAKSANKFTSLECVCRFNTHTVKRECKRHFDTSKNNQGGQRHLDYYSIAARLVSHFRHAA
ncbi:hypothetical protein CBX96_06465 [Shewanella sp. BC20]|nr:hypothetical protein CBX96_06465 [Shewanella sp. BC20]